MPAEVFDRLSAVKYTNSSELFVDGLTLRQTPGTVAAKLPTRSTSDTFAATKVKEPPDDRSQLALAMEWASRITTVSVEMVAPIVGGYWLDGWCGTEPALTVAGAVFGLIAGMWHLLRMTRSSSAAGSGPNVSDKTKKQ